MKKTVKIILSVIICTSILLGLSFGYLKYNLNVKTAKVQQKEDNVPYRKIPSNCGISLVFLDDSACLFYLDFKRMCINVVNISDFDENLYSYSGYTNDFSMRVNTHFIEGIVDRVGGIDLTNLSETLRYTGSQVVDYLTDDNTLPTRKEIISQLFEKISKNGFSKDDFVYIIENSESNLNLIDCIYWIDFLKDMSKNVEFENF